MKALPPAFRCEGPLSRKQAMDHSWGAGLSTTEDLAFAKKARSDPKAPALFTPAQNMMVKVGRAPRFQGSVVLARLRVLPRSAERPR